MRVRDRRKLLNVQNMADAGLKSGREEQTCRIVLIRKKRTRGKVFFVSYPPIVQPRGLQASPSRPWLASACHDTRSICAFASFTTARSQTSKDPHGVILAEQHLGCSLPAASCTHRQASISHAQKLHSASRLDSSDEMLYGAVHQYLPRRGDRGCMIGRRGAQGKLRWEGNPTIGR